jgi:hypothetical protein
LIKVEMESSHLMLTNICKSLLVYQLFSNLILENPRPYDVVTMFTVKTGCA